ncbi:alpha/beta hydrolase [Roseovarius sp. CAU 1744]|uniref:alpha/beta fold hydrolase n=1 Tax=Roseovarius sp. CAU 1744 TaxID=3140368 RepID=UPI00325ABC1E
MSWLLLALVAAAIAAPYLAERGRPRMGDHLRQQAPGQFVTLSRGVTHYQWRGPDDAPVAVCVHGLTTPSFVWGPIAEGLVAMGFRVLTYDLYGRGYSDRPRGDQDAAFFVAQLEELLENQQVDGEFTLMGYSMGGAISAAYAAKHPGRLHQLVLLAPAGLGHDLGPIARLVANRKWLGGWLMMAWYGRSYAQALEAERDLRSAIPGIVDRQKSELGYRGFRGAVLASMRGILDTEQEADHRQIAAAGTPVLAIWGRDDEVIPIAGKQKLTGWNPDAVNGVVEDAGHALAYTHPGEVIALLRKTLILPGNA